MKITNGKDLKSLRKSLNLSQGKFADLIKMNVKNKSNRISEIETGKRPVPFQLLIVNDIISGEVQGKILQGKI